MFTFLSGNTILYIQEFVYSSANCSNVLNINMKYGWEWGKPSIKKPGATSTICMSGPYAACDGYVESTQCLFVVWMRTYLSECEYESCYPICGGKSYFTNI